MEKKNPSVNNVMKYVMIWLGVIIVISLALLLFVKSIGTFGDSTDASNPSEAEVQVDMNADNPNTYTLPQPSDTIREEFLGAMQSYIDVSEEMCEYLRQNKQNSEDADVIAKSDAYRAEFNEISDMFEAWGNKKLSDDEILVYQQVSQYVMQLIMMSV